MTTVQIRSTHDQVAVQSPYNAAFVAAARDLGGKWSAPEWVFDARDEQRVRDLCRDVYGTDGVTSDTVTLRVEWRDDERTNRAPLVAKGRPIARAFGRDSGATLADGVVLLAGKFRSGGSVKNWGTVARAGTTVLIRDFPREAAAKLAASEDVFRRYAIEPEAAPVDRDALVAERERLLARIDDIDATLAQE